MDMTTFINTLLSTGNPVLPDPVAMRVALHLVWAVVLGSGVLFMTRSLARPYRLGWSALVVLWTLVPSSASPAYWLGLAFQTPSLTSAVLCLSWFLRQVWPAQGAALIPGPCQMKGLAVAGMVLGWVLLLDTLAVWPVSVYAWGFSAAAVGIVAALVMLFWAVWGDSRTGFPWLMLGVLALFVITHLPTGNVWDALIDPWLWVGLQIGWLVSAVRRWRAKRSPATIRA